MPLNVITLRQRETIHNNQLVIKTKELKHTLGMKAKYVTCQLR